MVVEYKRARDLQDYYAVAQEAWDGRQCALKHHALVAQIKKEGLWRRMGMDAQPWLQ